MGDRLLAKAPPDDKDMNKCFGAILDYARVSVAFSSPEAMLAGMKALKTKLGKGFAGVKNGLRMDFKPPASGYRDMKLVSWFSVDADIKLKDGKTFPKGSQMLVEIQLLLQEWLINKRATSV